MKQLADGQKNYIHKLEKKNQQMCLIVREHETLERFILQLNELCTKNSWQFCGIRKISPESEPPFYVGFVMAVPINVDPNSSYFFDVFGYKSTNLSRLPQVYYARIRQEMQPAPYNIKNRLELIDHKTDEPLRSNGIGSAGMSVIKELALQLHCSEIYGQREPDHPEDLEKLKRFYAFHGFAQSETGMGITFDMKRYVPPYRKKAAEPDEPAES